MSTTPPPDRPTERLQPMPPPPVYEGRGVASAVDPNVVLLRLEDAIGSLRTGLTIVGVIAVAALAVAIYALVQADDSSSGGSRSGLATDSRVSQLEDRVDRLSRQVQSLRSGGGSSGDTAALDSRITALERTVKTLASRPSTDPTQAIDELSGRLDGLSRDVEELKQAQPTP
jgi:polyhydroxyalkanoate synthesis regulator phasin